MLRVVSIALVALIVFSKLDSATGLQIGPKIKGPKPKLPRWVGKTTRIVVNPHLVLANTVNPYVVKAAKTARIDPDAAKSAVDLTTNPVPTTTGVAVKTIEVTAKASVDQVKATGDFAHAVASGDMSKMGEALARFQDAQFRKDLNPAVIYTVQLATSLIPVVDRESYMEKPTLIRVVPDSTLPVDPRVVVYVNGMDESQTVAKAEAKLLANRLQREVDLLYNETRGLEADSLQAVYDRAWTLTQAAGLFLVPRQDRRPREQDYSSTDVFTFSCGQLGGVSDLFSRVPYRT